MHPVICTIGPFNLYSYGLMLAVAFLISSTFAKKEAKRQGINPELIFNLLFIVFIFGILGARIFYVIENFGYYSKNPAEIIFLQHGGLAFFGGLIFGTIAGIAYLKKEKLELYKVLDLVATFVALGHALGRIGCLLNGCCQGRESVFGIYFQTHDAVLIPTQAYSSLLLIIIYVFLRFLQKGKRHAGEIFFVYLLLYSIKRFFIEFWRADNPEVYHGLTLFQLLSVGVFFLALTKLILIRKSKIQHPTPNT